MNLTAGFGHSLSLGKRPALLLIDFVQAYFVPESPLYARVESARDSAMQLLAAARQAKIPIVHTCVEYQVGGADGGVFFRKLPALRCFERGIAPELCAFAQGLEPLARETKITKQYASAFFGTSLAPQLVSQQVDTVLIAGLSTSGCVRASTVDCCQHGFVPAVVQEAVGDRAAQPHDASLYDLQAKYAEVIALKSALNYLSML